MTTKILLFAIIISGLAACSPSYRSGQTPDDVYFSPARTIEEDRRDERKEEVRYESAEDRIIRRGINDPRYRNWDYGYDYGYTPYAYGYYYDYYYNPYYYPYPVYTTPYKPSVVRPINSTPRKVNLGSYTNNNYNIANTTTTPGRLNTKMNNAKPVYNNSNVRKPIDVQKVKAPVQTNTNNSNNNNTSTNTNNTRTYTPPASTNNNDAPATNNSGGSTRPPRKN
ncbi:MAG: hypothetical protein V4556_11530 [Bacteroidota bacterium]